MGLSAGLLAVGSLWGCSHTFFQSGLSAPTRSKLEVAMEALGGPTPEPVIDLRGRHAVEILIASLAVQAVTGDDQHQFDGMARTLFLALTDAQIEDPEAAFDQDLAWMGARVGGRVARSMGGSLGALGELAGGLAEAAGILPPSDTASEMAALRASLDRGGMRGCTELGHLVSYRSGILHHVHAEIAERSEDYLAWRDRLEGMHLMRASCGGDRRVVILFSENRGERAARVLGWHFMSAAQYARFEPRLRETLDLD